MVPIRFRMLASAFGYVEADRPVAQGLPGEPTSSMNPVPASGEFCLA